MRSVNFRSPRVAWLAAMVIVTTAAIVLMTARSEPRATQEQQAAAAVGEPPDDDGVGIDDGGTASVGPSMSTVGARADAATTSFVDGGDLATTSSGADGGQLETTTTGVDRAQVDLCDTTPPLTADPSCPGYRTTTLPPTAPVVTGTRMITSPDGCGPYPGGVTTTTGPPHCTGTVVPTITPPPSVTTDICSPNAVSTTHPSCAGDPYFCGAVTTVPTCPSRGSGG